MIAHGLVEHVKAGVIKARLPEAFVGQRLTITRPGGRLSAVVTGFQSGCALLSAPGSLDGVRAGCEITSHEGAAFTFGTAQIGRSIDPQCGVPLPAAPLPLQRKPLGQPLWTSVRALDGLLTLARGARVGVFGPPGAGKSSLLHAIACNARADAVVIGLCGERGREASEWMHAAPAHASVVCATSDCSAAQRIAAAETAMLQAHALRARGLHVLLLLDSLARYANASRELALACGEPVGRGGYPPGVFAQLARYLEVAGTCGEGSITLIATVLSDGDERDPVSDAARSLLDGHWQLSAKLAAAGRFPAIDVLQSSSRTINGCAGREHGENAAIVRAAIALLEETADGRSLGIVPVGEAAGRVVPREEAINGFLRQGPEPSAPSRTLAALAALADTLR